MLNEKRGFMRFDICVIMEFKPTKEAAKYSWGITRNFSSEGFSFESNFDFEPRKNFEIKLRFLGGKVVSVLADVVWNERYENRYLAGIRLREKDKKVKREILKEISDYGNVSLDRILVPLNR